jgi:mercuric ion binding protein
MVSMFTPVSSETCPTVIPSAREAVIAPIRFLLKGKHPVTRLLRLVLFSFGLLASLPAFAAERTIILTVQNMYCAACPFVVKKSLEAIPGVGQVAVSYKDKTATVTYDDSKADLEVLTGATTNAGYPSAPKS